MKKLILLTFATFCFSMNAQERPKKEKQKQQIVEASCGQCQFGMNDQKGCDLAVRIDGKSYFVDGTKLDDHGDAHAHDGFCSVIRKAVVEGKVKDNKFVVTYFKLIPTKK
jgi:hypothetical protein